MQIAKKYLVIVFGIRNVEYSSGEKRGTGKKGRDSNIV